MNTAPISVSEDPVFGEQHFFSHVMLAIVGLITAIGAVGVAGAFWSMGRQGYRKD